MFGPTCLSAFYFPAFHRVKKVSLLQVNVLWVLYRFSNVLFQNLHYWYILSDANTIRINIKQQQIIWFDSLRFIKFNQHFLNDNLRTGETLSGLWGHSGGVALIEWLGVNGVVPELSPAKGAGRGDSSFNGFILSTQDKDILVLLSSSNFHQ